ncbi:hypothetical protein BDV96DRAFT_641832 [Lophiotrema nucula]|uniref:Rhodopsin domain-containing protein n=1 Tax=Lophiotrema nucula TaxID=690887 RepID=A0A6A5ZL10_9PLEO|nr:hypothetical protein BDV96DRAFT_641832 [Lophiotrema nucula]
MAEHSDGAIVQRGEQQKNVAIAFLVLTWIFILLRIWTRTYVIASFGWDDGTMILATVIFTVYCSIMLFIGANGGGTHVTNFEELFAIAGEATYLITIMMMKISLGIFFARIVVKTYQLWLIYITVGLNVLSSAGSVFYCILRCGADLDQYVSRQLQDLCPSRNLDRFFAFQQASVTTLTDCILATLPVLILWNASMDKRSKVSVGLILSLAALGCVCSIVRFKYVEGLTEIDDFFWNATNIAIWSTIEPGAGIIAGCLATLRPFLKSFLHTARSIHSSTMRSDKHFSRFSPWGGESSYQRSGGDSHSQASDARTSRTGTSADRQSGRDQDFELQSDVSRKGKSTDNILPPTKDIIHPWPSRQDRSFDLEPSGTQRTERNKRASDGYDLDRPLPAVPPDSHKRSISMV